MKCSSNRAGNPGHDPRGEARGGDGATRAIYRNDKNNTDFENGAVVNLNSRVSLGRCVFLRNDQSGREILCKVLNLATSRPGGLHGSGIYRLAIRDLGESVQNKTPLLGAETRDA